MSALVPVPRFCLAELYAMIRHPTRDHRYFETRLGPTIQEYLAWLRLARRSARTLDQYERDLARLALAVPEKRIGDVAVEDLMLLLGLIPDGSWRRCRAAWSGMFRWAQRFGVRPDNPCDMLPPVKPPTPAVYPIFSAAERAALVTGTARAPLPELERARVLLLLETGARKGEARRMLLEHVDLVERLAVLHGKGGKERLVPLRGEVIQALDLLRFRELPVIDRALRPGDHVWFPARWARTRDGDVRVYELDPARPMSQRGWHEWWQRTVGRAGVVYRKPHMTRHTFATDLLDATAGDLYAVKEFLGHASTRTTEIYLHSSRRRMDAAADQLAAFRRGGE